LLAVIGTAMVALAPARAGAAPAKPVIFGAIREGSTLLVGMHAHRAGFQWQRCSLIRRECRDIAGANRAAYTLAADDVGTHLRARARGTSRVSAITDVIRPGPPVNATRPHLRGTAATGRTLSATSGGWRGTATIAVTRFRWMRCDRSGSGCVAIPHATLSSYQVTGWDWGHRLRVVAYASNSFGTTQATSSPSATVDLSHGTADFKTALLTGPREYGIVSTPTRASVQSTSSDGNVREVFWPRSARVAADGESCATWSSQSSRLVQQGAALRIHAVSGGYRAITVTKNVWFGVNWIFNFHVFDTSRRTLYASFGHVDLSDAFKAGNKPRPLPWHLCARTRGSTVEFKVWRGGTAEPAYGVPGAGGSKRLPAGWSAPGTAGWYIGHVPALGGAVLDNLRIN
jgi:hypothetical protein